VTDPMMALLDYMRKQDLTLDRDFLQDAVRAFAQLLIELEVSEQIGAERYERIESRTNQRNGYGERTWETRVGNLPLQIPKLRKGSYFPSLLEPRKRSEKALLAVVQEAYVKGVSTRKVDDLVKALGLEGMDKSKVSRICRDLNELVEVFRNRPVLAGQTQQVSGGRLLRREGGDAIDGLAGHLTGIEMDRAAREFVGLG
jgi:putative transposase